MARTGALAATTALVLLVPRAASSYATGDQASGTWSFPSHTAYLQQPECIKDCFWHTEDLGQDDVLNSGLVCSPPWTNECFCNPQSASLASYFLSNCVAAHCTSSTSAPPFPCALSAYNNYCSANGYSIPTVASIQSFSAYATQPRCVKACLWIDTEPAPGDPMAGAGCHSPWWDNACLCNAGMASDARAFLLTCVARKCSTATDAPQVSAAVSIHAEYCKQQSVLTLPL
jgi:hypothetical protein